MLYERWRQIAEARAGELALRDCVSGRRWTFSELAAEAERHPAIQGFAHPQGNSPEFVLTVLAAWRDRKIVWPLESGCPPTAIPAPPSNCAHLKTTSGTSGEPRMAAFTAEQLAADADNIVATMSLTPEQPNLGVISLAHSYGFSNLVTPLLLHGIPLILAPSVLPEAIRQSAASEKSLTLAAVPSMWRSWHEVGAITASVRLAISAGAPLPLALERQVFTASGLKIHNFYGASECGGIAYDATEVPRKDATLAGSPMQSVRLSVNDEGCLSVHSKAAGETYWPHVNDALGVGKFDTSDVAELRDGAVYLRGRLGDQINVAGRKLWPETVERALLAHPGVRECVVFGAPSSQEERAETVMAVLSTTATESELKSFLLQTLPAWQVPREWRFVPSLAAGPRGKISRAEWRRRILQESPLAW